MDNKVTEYFKKNGIELEALFTGEDTSTVHKAAEVLGVEDGQIAKSLAVNLPATIAKAGVGIVVAMGTAKLANAKFKKEFQCKARMLSAEETLEKTGFPVGGVCPFGLPEGVPVFLDESLKKFKVVYPAAGTRDSAVKVEIDRFAEYTGGIWVDVCKEVE